jgi:hypothetical protein
MIVYVIRDGCFIKMMAECPSNSVNRSTRLKFVKYSLRIYNGYIYPVQVTTLHQYIVFTWKPCITFEINGTTFVRRIEQMQSIIEWKYNVVLRRYVFLWITIIEHTFVNNNYLNYPGFYEYSYYIYVTCYYDWHARAAISRDNTDQHSVHFCTWFPLSGGQETAKRAGDDNIT